MATDELSTVFAALADPTRRAILARLAQGQATVNEVASPFAMSLQAVSKHLKVLERAGLIVRRRDARWRPCRIQPAGLRAVAEWTEQYRPLWEERYERLEGYLRDLTERDLQRDPKEEGNEPGKKRGSDGEHTVGPGDRDDPRL